MSSVNSSYIVHYKLEKAMEKVNQEALEQYDPRVLVPALLPEFK
jgi:hypothetical protein